MSSLTLPQREGWTEGEYFTLQLSLLHRENQKPGRRVQPSGSGVCHAKIWRRDAQGHADFFETTYPVLAQLRHRVITSPAVWGEWATAWHPSVLLQSSAPEVRGALPPSLSVCSWVYQGLGDSFDTAAMSAEATRDLSHPIHLQQLQVKRGLGRGMQWVALGSFLRGSEVCCTGTGFLRRWPPSLPASPYGTRQPVLELGGVRLAFINTSVGWACPVLSPGNKTDSDHPLASLLHGSGTHITCSIIRNDGEVQLSGLG